MAKELNWIKGFVCHITLLSGYGVGLMHLVLFQGKHPCCIVCKCWWTVKQACILCKTAATALSTPLLIHLRIFCYNTSQTKVKNSVVCYFAENDFWHTLRVTWRQYWVFSVSYEGMQKCKSQINGFAVVRLRKDHTEVKQTSLRYPNGNSGKWFIQIKLKWIIPCVCSCLSKDGYPCKSFVITFILLHQYLFYDSLTRITDYIIWRFQVNMHLVKVSS